MRANHGEERVRFQAHDRGCRTLRGDSTPPEELRWLALRNGQIGGLKFRRQHPIGQYVVDFYCHSAKLVVESME